MALSGDRWPRMGLDVERLFAGQTVFHKRETVLTTFYPRHTFCLGGLSVLPDVSTMFGRPLLFCAVYSHCKQNNPTGTSPKVEHKTRQVFIYVDSNVLHVVRTHAHPL